MVADIRAAIAEARKDGAPSVSPTADGKTINESQPGEPTGSPVSAQSMPTEYA